MNATILQKNEKLHRFEDGDETIVVRVRELPGGNYIAVDNDTPDVAGFGLSNIGAIADLFEKLPRAASEREERDERAARFDHAQDHRKNYQAAE